MTGFDLFFKKNIVPPDPQLIKYWQNIESVFLEVVEKILVNISQSTGCSSNNHH